MAHKVARVRKTFQLPKRGDRLLRYLNILLNVRLEQDIEVIYHGGGKPQNWLIFSTNASRVSFSAMQASMRMIKSPILLRIELSVALVALPLSLW